MWLIHTCLQISVPDWCTHLSYFPAPFQWPTRDDTNNILSCSENKSNEFRKIEVQKEWKNNQLYPCKINTSSLGTAHREPFNEWPDQVTDWYRIYLSETGISDPQGQTQRVKSAAMVYQMANPHSRFRDSSLTSVHHQKCFHYNNFLSHVTAFLSLRNRGYKKCSLFKVFQDVMIISCAVKLTQSRRTESLEGLLIFSHKTLQLLKQTRNCLFLYMNIIW